MPPLPMPPPAASVTTNQVHEEPKDIVRRQRKQLQLRIFLKSLVIIVNVHGSIVLHVVAPVVAVVVVVVVVLGIVLVVLFFLFVPLFLPHLFPPPPLVALVLVLLLLHLRQSSRRHHPKPPNKQDSAEWITPAWFQQGHWMYCIGRKKQHDQGDNDSKSNNNNQRQPCPHLMEKMKRGLVTLLLLTPACRICTPAAPGTTND